MGGYVFSHGRAAVSWASKKQTLVALPTEEAEYTGEALWIRQLLSNIGLIDLDNASAAIITIYADNQSALKHVRTEGITARTKHFDIRLQHSRDNQSKGRSSNTSNLRITRRHTHESLTAARPPETSGRPGSRKQLLGEAARMNTR